MVTSARGVRRVPVAPSELVSRFSFGGMATIARAAGVLMALPLGNDDESDAQASAKNTSLPSSTVPSCSRYLLGGDSTAEGDLRVAHVRRLSTEEEEAILRWDVKVAEALWQGLHNFMADPETLNRLADWQREVAERAKNQDPREKQELEQADGQGEWSPRTSLEELAADYETKALLSSRLLEAVSSLKVDRPNENSRCSICGARCSPSFGSGVLDFLEQQQRMAGGGGLAGMDMNFPQQGQLYDA
mmetsp:Transcript_26853/g.49726  ORF Transcript_26853/g.49726 Transcript_26853/m.49726 type:complete len:246 (+) Transcript_26853:2400-3137(+)